MNEPPAADEQGVGRVERDSRLHRLLPAASMRHRGDRAFEHLQEGVLDAQSHVLADRPTHPQLADLGV
jgi:hypothetical protein